ncbi:MAG: energy transducer TonB [Prevotella sp.]|nr:energy transducer TonB [Prevotella sp.]
MTTLFLTYELKVAVLIAVFYVFWRLLVANETWHRLNRIVLLSTAIASFLLPLCVITIHQTVEVAPTVADTLPLPTGEMTIPMEPAPAMENAEIEKPFNWQLPLTIIYIIGVLVVLSRMLLSLWRLHRMKAESEIHPLTDGRQIAVCDKAKTPFSWWKTVFLNHQDFEDGTTAFLTHELGHLRLHHSADVLLVELLTALQWFNPAMWMLRADLRTIHEYEADQQVISHGFNDIQYLQLLIRKAAGQSGYSLANGISNSALKKRVTMIMKPKSNHRQWLRFAYILPIIAFSLYASCETKVSYKTIEESALTFDVRDNREYVGVKVPAGAFYTWLVNGHLAERGVVKEDKWLNVRSYFPLNEDLVTLDGKEIDRNNMPYVPLSSIKEVKLLQGERPRRIELYTHHVTEFNRDADFDYPTEYKEKVKAWMFFKAEDAATGLQLKGAEITVVETGQKAKTNEEGWCELKVPLGTTVKASYPGLGDETYEISQINGNEVQGRTFWMSKPDKHIYMNVDKKAEFDGDKDGWLAKNTQLPKATNGKGLSGRVGIWLVVNEDGSVSGVRLKQGVNETLNEEALRLFRSMPRWKPAIKDGQPVKSLVLSSVSFDNIQDNVLIAAYIRDEKTQKYLNDANAELMTIDKVVLSKPMVREVVRGSKWYRYVWAVPRQDKYIIKVSKQGYKTEYMNVSIQDSESQKLAGDIILRPKS